MTDLILFDWITLLLRWLHVITALAWIGASFYLISWENKFNRLRNLREGVEGDFWTIQGGDFYFVEKLKSAPARLPDELHWFKYEAYFTWLTGFVLMCVIYYAKAGVMLLDPWSPLQTPMQAVLASLVSLAGSWAIYALYCRTPWARNLRISALLGVVFTALLAAFFGYLFNGRAAFVHTAAALGTIMSANVFFAIIPWHKRLISAIESSQDLEEIYRAHPGFRSRHNHYLTLPVLFLMLSAHAPIAFDGRMSWLVLTALVLAMGLLKHFHTCIQKRQPSASFLLTGLLVFSAAMMLSATDSEPLYPCAENITFEQVDGIIGSRCTGCHSRGSGQIVAASGKIIPDWSRPGQLMAFKTQLLDQLVTLESMPPGNITGMTQHERSVLACWLEKGSDTG